MKSLLITLNCFLISTLAICQEKKVIALFTEAPITLDANLNEPDWQRAMPADAFWQYFPKDSVQATHQTEIRFLFSERTLYVGIKVYSQGDNYVVPSLRRDFRAGGSDNVTLMFDTFNDGNNAFLFGTNPEGVRREALVSGGGTSLRGFTTSWDTKWRGETKQYDGYYISEWAIPFSAFKFKTGETQWRFNSYQFDTQDNTRNTWIRIPQNQFIFNLAYMGILEFEKPLGSSKSPISIIPYTNAITGKDFENTSSFSDITFGGDMRFTVGNSLNLDLTFNPDFSQVEVDQQVTNLTRFEINLPERRQFFIENSDLFADFGDPQNANPFFSRRIGIAQDSLGNTIANDILAGVRLSGKLNNDFRVGLLNMQTQEDVSNKIAAQNHSVVALQHKLFSRSNISFLFVNRQQTSNNSFGNSLNNYNRVVGVDYNLANADNSWNGKAYIHKSFTPNITGNAISAGLRMQYNSKHWRISGNSFLVGENFQSDLGFIRRKGVFNAGTQVEYLHFPNKGFINRHNFSVAPFFTWTTSDPKQLADYQIDAQWFAELKNTANINAGITTRYTYLFNTFDPSRAGGLALPANSDYRFSQLQIGYRSNAQKTVFFSVRSVAGQFFNGSLFTQQADLNVRIQPRFVLSIQGRYDIINLPDPYEDNRILLLGPRVEVTFSKSLFWNTFIQYNSLIENIGINSRLQWRFAPLSDLFIVYNDNYFTAGNLQPRFRTLNLKFTYWLYL